MLLVTMPPIYLFANCVQLSIPFRNSLYLLTTLRKRDSSRWWAHTRQHVWKHSTEKLITPFPCTTDLDHSTDEKLIQWPRKSIIWCPFALYLILPPSPSPVSQYFELRTNLDTKSEFNEHENLLFIIHIAFFVSFNFKPFRIRWNWWMSLTCRTRSD